MSLRINKNIKRNVFETPCIPYTCICFALLTASAHKLPVGRPLSPVKFS